MGQTLPNGIYLPAEGERNCYDGLEGNWRSLDGLISTVAGKASASHSHGNITNDGKVGTTANKPLITGTGGVVQAGSFGNQANTFCEGNDSRLSDARTPVAHTHTKADVTDLLNSNFIPSANNSYDLGSSSYQWKSVYAQSYYYNSTEFQEKFATLDTVQTISERKNLKQYWHLIASNLKAGAGETYGRTGYSFIYTDKNDVTLGDVTLYKQSQAARTYLRIRGGDYYTNGVPDASGTLVQGELRIGTLANGSRMIECYTDAMYPGDDNTANLGTSSKRWKSFNGVNPGALSLPSTTSQSIDTTEWVTNSWSPNYCDAPFDGYISIACFANSLQINNETKSYGMTFQPGDDGFVIGLMPVCSGDHIKVAFVKTQTSLYEGYKFIKANGNV